MRRQATFGKRGRNDQMHRKNVLHGQPSIKATVDSYDDPVLTKFAVTRPWPAYAAAGLTAAITLGTCFGGGTFRPPSGRVIVVMLFVGLILYLQFRGLQKGMQGVKEKRKRAIQAEYPLLPVVGMAGGLGYFMITKDQNFSDILAYDWSGIFGLRRGMEGEEPLTATLFDTMARGGGAGIGLGVLWYKVSGKGSA